MVESNQARTYGVILPHFGKHASRQSIVKGAVDCERLGFEAVWVRDHIVFHPHGHEGSDPTFVDPMIALAAVAAATETITLGTGCLIPHRHPVHAALLFGSLAVIAGSDRIIAGFGLGSFDHEFEVVGMGGWDRRIVIEEQVEVFRKIWSGEEVSHKGPYYEFSNTEIHPTPYGKDLPIWYSGTSPASVRRAVEYCDGWIPGRMPRHNFAQRVQRMREYAEKHEKPVPPAGVIPYVSPGRSLAEATAAFDVDDLLDEARQRYTAPDGGTIRGLEDLNGAIIAGTPDHIVEQVMAYHEVGCSHFVFDFRMRFDDWDECIQMVGEEVLPALRSV